MANLSSYKVFSGSTNYVQEFQDFVDQVETLFNTLPKIQESESLIALDTSTGGATLDLDLSVASYFYTDTALAANSFTFTFSNPAIEGRISKFRVELLDADGATLTWPAEVVWEGGTEPSWTAANTDIAEFTTRDAGATWWGRRVYTNLA